jgi:predicted dinucleotide-utilizing enzyme
LEKQTIAIVGLGRVGTAFLAELLEHPHSGVEIVAVVEQGETLGKAMARASGINVIGMTELLGIGERLDILFDLTGDPAVRKELRENLRVTKNFHTIVATENIAKMIWALISRGDDLPEVHGETGY